MPRDWKGPFSRRLQVRASERGRRMARRRWEMDRARRDHLAAIALEQRIASIAKRIVVIWGERNVREAVIYDADSIRVARRKEREVLRAPILRR